MLSPNDFIKYFNIAKKNSLIFSIFFGFFLLWVFGFKVDHFVFILDYISKADSKSIIIFILIGSLGFLSFLFALRENSAFIFDEHAKIRKKEELEKKEYIENVHQIADVIKNKIHAYISEILNDFKCDRVGIILYSNGKHTSTGIPFYFATLSFLKETNEVNSIYDKWQFVNLDNIRDWTDPLMNGGEEFILDVDVLEKTDKRRADIMRSYHHTGLLQICFGKINSKEVGYLSLMYVKDKPIIREDDKTKLRMYRDILKKCLTI